MSQTHHRVTQSSTEMIFSSYLINKRLKLRETLCYSVVNRIYFSFYVGLTMIVLPELVTQSVTFIVARIGCGNAAEGRLNRVIRNR